MKNAIGLGIYSVLLALASGACRTDVTVIELSKPPSTASEPSVIVAGNYHACALMADSTVRCWGSNAWGQLGTGSLEDQLRPAVVRGLSGVAQIAAGGNSTCARMNDGTVRCWGDNAYCQVGSDVGGAGGTQSPRGRGGLDPDIVSPDAVEVPGVRGAVQLAMDGLQSCALLSDGSVRCWGRHYTMYDTHNPARAPECQRSIATVPSLTDVVSIRATTRGGTCATRMDGSVACWQLTFGLGPSWGTPVQLPPPPTVIAGVSNAASALRLHAMTTLERRPALETSCVLLADHTVSCAGENAVGMLGDGTRSSRTTFAPVAGLSDAVRIVAFGERVCAQLSSGAVSCWGVSPFSTPEEQHTANPDLCPITGNSLPCALAPHALADLGGVRDLAMGEGFTCAYLDDGTVRCRGINAFGELGNGTRTDSGSSWITVQF